MIRTLIHGLILGLLLSAPPVVAQDPAQPTPDATDKDTQTVEPAQEANQADAQAENNNAQAPAPSPHDYRPSEEISEDLSVSFPVDI